MNATPPAPSPGVLALAREAGALEARGAFEQAAAAWARAVELEPAFLPAHLGLAQAQIRAGRPADALPVLERLGSGAPQLPGLWLAKGVALSMLGRHDEAVASASRAAALAPTVAALRMGLGDVLRLADRLEAAAVAYREAVELAPEDADALNKLATVERTMRHLDVAETLLRRAHARSPRHPYARVNLGTLELELGRNDAGRTLLASALRDSALPADAREEAADALAMLDERTALEQPVADALGRGDPAPIAHALRSLDRRAPPDERILADLARIVDRHAGAPSVDDRFARGAPASAAWPALEAHHSFGLPRTDEAIASSVALVANAGAARSVEELDVVHYARAVAEAGDDAPDLADPIAFEAWLRWRHAQIARHRPKLGPGQFSILNNVVRNARDVPRTPPVRIPATLRKILGELAPRMPDGCWRAVFVYLTVGELHPFTDANGRTMRLLLNRLLLRAGRFPHLRPAGGDSEIVAAARATGDLEPLVDWLAAGSRYAAELDGAWRAREGR